MFVENHDNNNDEEDIREIKNEERIKRKRLNLKNSFAFVDENRPELVFYVPKQWVEYGARIRSGVHASVYLARGDPTWALDVDASDVLCLLPKKKLMISSRLGEKKRKERGRGIRKGQKGEEDKLEEQEEEDYFESDLNVMRVEEITVFEKNRSADVLLVSIE